MADKNRGKFEEQLGLLETKVERVYDITKISENKELTEQLNGMSLRIKEILLQNIDGAEGEMLNKIIEQVNQEAEELIKHLVELFRKQEKQEAMYNISRLYSKTLDSLVEDIDEVKAKCIAQARNCVSDIDSIFDEVEQLYSTEMEELELEDKNIIQNINSEIRKCRNIIHEIHSQHTYKIEEQIVNHLDKTAKTLSEIKAKNVEEKNNVRIKGGVTNSQSGKYSLSDIIASKTEVITDIPKRTSLQEFWD